MIWQANPYSLPSFGAAVIAGIVAALAWRRRPAVGAGPLGLLSAAVAVWSLAYAWYWVAPSPAQQLLALNAGSVGAGLAPLALLMFVLTMTRCSRRWLNT